MTTVVRIDDRGRLLLPEAVRRRLGIRPGGSVVVEERKGGVVVKRPNRFLEEARKHPWRKGITLEQIEAMEDEMYG